jgi:hypothetical protein
MALNVGDFVTLDGYQKMAQAQDDFGTVFILTNNSSHYLVVTVNEEAMSDGEGVQGRLEESFHYEGDDQDFDDDGSGRADPWQEAYRKALARMTDIVLRRI